MESEYVYVNRATVSELKYQLDGGNVDQYYDGVAELGSDYAELARDYGGGGFGMNEVMSWISNTYSSNFTMTTRAITYNSGMPNAADYKNFADVKDSLLFALCQVHTHQQYDNYFYLSLQIV